MKALMMRDYKSLSVVKKIGIVIALVQIVLPFRLLGQVGPDSIQIAAWDAFNNFYTNNWTVRWNENTGTPAFLFGHKTHPYGGTPDQIARIFLLENKTMFNMKDTLQDLTLERIRESQGITHIKFRQTYEGVPVYSAEYYVHIGSDNRINMVNGKYFPNIQANVNPTLTDSEAINYAETQVTIQGPLSSQETVELVLYPVEDSFILVWKVILPNVPYAIWRCFVNASNGQTLYCEDILMRTQGLANVYPIDPENSNRTEVTIYRLTPPGYELDGTYVTVGNANLEEGDAYSEDSDFRFSPPWYTVYDPTHFDEANVYYHVDKFAHEYLPTIGFAGIEQQIVAIVHEATDNAYGGLNGLLFGAGIDNFWDIAKKDDIIYHEYTHAVTEYIGLEHSGESNAMNEGYADYFAASYTNDHIFGEWVTKHSCCTHMRTLQSDPNDYNYDNYSNPPHYPVDPNPYNTLPYRRSMIWSGTLWDLREAIGQSTADALIYQGLEFVNGFATFEGGRYGILQADLILEGGANQNIIKDVFDTRGINYVAPLPPTGFSVSGSTGDFPVLSWDANSEPDLAGYKVFRSLNYGPFILIATVDNNTITYTDYGVVVGGKFDPRACWYVKAYDVTYQESTPSAMKCKNVRIQKVSAGSEMPETFTLHWNYPNPFNPITTISYDLPEASYVSLVIYNILGKEVQTLLDRREEAGFKSVIWDGKDNSGKLASAGIYIYALKAWSRESEKTYHKTKKMVLLR